VNTLQYTGRRTSGDAHVVAVRVTVSVARGKRSPRRKSSCSSSISSAMHERMAQTMLQPCSGCWSSTGRRLAWLGLGLGLRVRVRVRGRVRVGVRVRVRVRDGGSP